MTQPWNPFALTFDGTPITGQVATKVVVFGPALTPVQAGHVKAWHLSFISRARLSIVQNIQEQGLLPDGSPIRASIIEGVVTLWVHTVGGEPTVVTKFGGVVRQVGGILQGDDTFLYREFKENRGPGNSPAVYKDTAKLYGEPGTQSELNSSPIWQAFSSKSLSGPAAKLAQFGRGAVRAYHQYFESKGIPLTSRDIGAAVVVLPGVGGAPRKAWCFGDYVADTGVWAIPMTIAPLADFPGLKPPQEILDIFDGIPIPPTLVEWEAEIDVLIPSGRLHELLGAPAGGLSQGDLILPAYATQGSGNVVHFVVGYLEFPLPGDTVRSIKYTARMRLDITRSGDSPIGSVAIDVAKGISNFNIPESYVPEGTHVGPVGVTHVDGVLTTFTSTIVVNPAYKASAEAGVITTVKKATSRVISWPGGSVQTMSIDELQAVSGNYSGSTQLASLGTRTETIPGPPETVNTYARWQQQSTISANWTFVRKAKPTLGQIYGFGVEGCFLVTLSSQPAFVQNGFVGSASSEDAVIEVLINSTSGGDSTDFPNLDPTYYARDYSATLIWHGDLATEFVGPGMSLTPGQVSQGHSGYPSTSSMGWLLSLPLGWLGDVSETVLTEFKPVEYLRDELHANGQVVNTDALAVFRDFETDAEYDSLAASGVAWTLDTPIAYIRDETGIRRRQPPLVHISQLGGFQLVYNLSNYSRRHSEQRSWSTERGTMVSTPYDHAYDASKIVTFVGELQP